jgi:hypothetical protein
VLHLQLHGGSEAEGWAALAAARDAMRVALAGKIRRRTDAGQLEGRSEEKIQEQAAAEYNDTVLQTVCGLAGWLFDLRLIKKIVKL